MAGPGDEIAAGAGGRGHMRASHADREQVIGTLKVAFVQGMLAKDEFDLRVGQTFASRTYAELAALTADLPAGLTAAQPPTSAQTPGEARVLRPGPVIKVATVLYAAVWPFALLLPWPKDGDGDRLGAVLLVFFSTLLYLYVSAVAGCHLLASRREKRSGRQPPRRPAASAGGQAPRLPPSVSPEGQRPPVDPGHQHTAEVARRRLPRPALPGSGSLRRWHPWELLTATAGNRHAMSAQVVKPANP
jgi:Domain of unknown function (DUF1707)